MCVCVCVCVRACVRACVPACVLTLIDLAPGYHTDLSSVSLEPVLQEEDKG